MNKAQKEAAISCFKVSPDLHSLMITEDGNCFTSQNLCSNHAREQRLNKDLTVTVSRTDFAKELGEEVKEETGGQASGEGDTQKPIGKMNRTELEVEAAKFKIAIPAKATNKDIVALIEAALEAEPNAADGEGAGA